MSQKSCCVPQCPITADDAAIYKQEDTITDNDETNINISMKRKNADCSNSTHNYLNDEYSKLKIDKTYDDDQKVYIEIDTEMDLSHTEDDKNCINLEIKNSDVVGLVKKVNEDYVTHDSSVGNNVKIENEIDPEVYIERSKKSEKVINESLKITNEDLQIKIEIDVNDEDKEKIVENEAGVTVDLSIVKQEVDNGIHVKIKEVQNKVDDLEIKKEVEDCNEVLKGIEMSKSKSHFEVNDDTNIGAIIAETETRVEPKAKDDIVIRKLRTIARENTFRMAKIRKCHSKIQDKASGDTYNCTKCLRIFKSFNEYVSHFFLHDIEPNACPLCERSYKSIKPLCKHIQNFHIAKSFVSLRLLNHEFEKKKTYKCLVCEDIVIKQHCFNHWEKHFRFEASKQLGLRFFVDVDGKLENAFSIKVMKKFNAANYKEDDTITDEETNINISMNRKNADCSNSTQKYLNEIVENEAGARVDLSIVRQEVDNGFHMQIKEEQNKVDNLEIKKEVEDCNEVLKSIEVSKLESDFEADDDTNIGAIIAETERRVEQKPEDDIQCDVDSNVLNRNLRRMVKVNTFRMEKCSKYPRTAYNHTMADQPHESMDLTDLPLPSRSNVLTDVPLPSKSNVLTDLPLPSRSNVLTDVPLPSKSNVLTDLPLPSRSNVLTDLPLPSRSNVLTVLPLSSRNNVLTVLPLPSRSNVLTVLPLPSRSNVLTDLPLPSRSNVLTVLPLPTRSNVLTDLPLPSRSNVLTVLPLPSRSNVLTDLPLPSRSNVLTVLPLPSRSNVLTDLPLPSRSNVLTELTLPSKNNVLTDLTLPSRINILREAQDAAKFTSATPFVEPQTIAAPKSKAQKQREYRQRIAASRTSAQAIAARKSNAERQRNRRLRKAANLAFVSGSLESTTASSSSSGTRSNPPSKAFRLFS